MAMRDDFPPSVKKGLAARVGYQCSNPSCRAFTSGPHSDPAKSVSIGEAAHISGASPNGPRYNPALSRHERRGIENGIWLCRICARILDTDVPKYTESVLRHWKHSAERGASIRLGKARRSLGPTVQPLREEEEEILVAAADRGEVVVLSSEQTGKWVAAGSFDFLNEADPEANARYLEAFESLLGRHFLRHDEGNLYVLTPNGFEIARELRARPVQKGVATVTGSEWVMFEPPLQFRARVRLNQIVWRGRGDICDLEITDVSAAGFRVTVKNKRTGEAEIPGWASATFNWTAELPD